MLRAGIAALCAVASCQAFHVQVASTSSWRSVTRQQDSFDRQALCHRRPRNSCSMAAADRVTASSETGAAAAAAKENTTGGVAKVEGNPVVAGGVAADKKMTSTSTVRINSKK